MIPNKSFFFGEHLNNQDYLALATQFPKFMVNEILLDNQNEAEKRRYLNHIYNYFKNTTNISATPDFFRSSIKKGANQISAMQEIGFAGQVLSIGELAVDVSSAIYAYHQSEFREEFRINKTAHTGFSQLLPIDNQVIDFSNSHLFFNWDFDRGNYIGQVFFELELFEIDENNVQTPLQSFSSGTETFYNLDLSIFSSSNSTHLGWRINALDDSSDIIVSSEMRNLFTSNTSITWPGETVFVQGGTFDMGSDQFFLNEAPVHSVNVNSFYISKYEITFQQYVNFLNEISADSNGTFNGIEFIDLSTFQFPISYNGTEFIVENGKENYPVRQVTWYGAKAFCEQYNGRLPTEAEWEYAASGGINSNDYLFSGSNDVNSVAWHSGIASGVFNEVGLKNPNELGIYDMSGNLSEWTNDWYDDNYYENSPSNNPQGPNTGTLKSTRGGSSFHSITNCRVTFRYPIDPSQGQMYLGFRIIF